MAFDNLERRTLDSFFNYGGYVMDFSSTSFDEFTEESVGIPIVTKYGLSKAKSLNKFFFDADENMALKLLSDLLKYYKKIFLTENPYVDEVKDMDKRYPSVVAILDDRKYIPMATIVKESKDAVTEKFDTEFVRNRLQQLEHQMKTDSAGSIGTSKDLLESVMKMILESLDVSYTSSNGKTDNIPTLWRKVQENLKLHPSQMRDDAIGKNAKRILAAMTQLVLGMDELRNQFGTGHGRDHDFNQLPIRYGKLTAVTTIALIEFLNDTMVERQTKEKNLG
ncbi:abortive infection family protein [Levilactobacillus brevis]|uniref:Abortive infection family protein n=1 Tax=Levilactobacillus brevis TaxID=1580 RepID=A0AA41JUH6_LEVBR|nr:abortive infection family protein [Levilactobacillus brevis]MBS1011619.1 abortive infection family protein [Levilactobacillus brevis]